jgi:hypothetical protein
MNQTRRRMARPCPFPRSPPVSCRVGSGSRCQQTKAEGSRKKAICKPHMRAVGRVLPSSIGSLGEMLARRLSHGFATINAWTHDALAFVDSALVRHALSRKGSSKLNLPCFLVVLFSRSKIFACWLEIWAKAVPPVPTARLHRWLTFARSRGRHDHGGCTATENHAGKLCRAPCHPLFARPNRLAGTLSCSAVRRQLFLLN